MSAREGGRWVEVAVDSAGPAGGQTFTYSLPDRLLDVEPGEAVLVDFGRRRALGIVLAARVEQPPVETRPIVDRVRSDGPLLPQLQLRLAEHVALHYLAPPALVVRQLLPPGLLERVTLYVRAGETAQPGDELTERIVAAGTAGIEVGALPAADGRAGLLRRLQARGREGAVVLEWRVRPPSTRERRERRVALTDEGRTAARRLAEGEEPVGRPLGPRQRALLSELLAEAHAQPAARLAERHGGSAIPGLVRRGWLDLQTVAVERRPLAGRAASGRGALPDGAALTPEQARLVDRVGELSRQRQFAGLLVEGVTASGKTAVYAAVIAAALAAGRQALVLVPEIALATPLVDRLRSDLQAEVALLHSALSDGERADEWRRVRSGEAPVVVGTRLAVLAPLADPGVIVVDEEHDAAYKSDRTPRLQARDVCLRLGELAGAPVLLGSATPDVVSVGRALLGQLERVRLPARVTGARPTVNVVDLRAELAGGNRGLLSGQLVDALAALDRQAGERAILVINRRGSASVVLCRDCGYVQVCPECHRPLVFHAASLALRCHHCGASAPVARRCPACGSPRIRYLGGGTERVEREVAIRFPEYRIGRLDRDVVERRGAADRVVDAFTNGELDVLVGTALVTKGLDVPEVTLVGIVSADVALNLPDERAAERTYQLLVQAIGRAGRGQRAGRALIQTYQPFHPAIVAAAEGDGTALYEAELEMRRRFGSPPYGQIVKLTIALEDRAVAERRASEMADALRERADRGPAGARTDVLGPAPAYIARRAGRWRFNLVLRGGDPLALLGGDPGPPWSVDVDPESLL
ncbi:MAG TPA: primosomal protein N' [Candidatus Limnocylindrales bacterium]|nr:primosomal protein N' [Candidatus Limnocylindrales bacterium]